MSNGVQNNGGRGVNDLKGLTVLTEDLVTVIDSGVFTAAVRRIMPEVATFLLQERNLRNRGLRRRDATNQSRDIETDNWDINGESVKFDWNGMMLDGQHRMEACRRAGKPIDTLVVTGLDPNVQLTVDTGIRRTNGDRFGLVGEENPNELAATVRRVWAWERGDRTFGSNFAPTPHEMTELLNEKPELRESTRVALEVYREFHAIPKSVLSSTHYVLSGIDESAASLFFMKLRTGAGMHVGHPILTLRNRAIKSHGANDQRKIRSFGQWVDYVFRSWNAFVTDRDLIRIQTGRDGRVVLPVGLKNSMVQSLAAEAAEAGNAVAS